MTSTPRSASYSTNADKKPAIHLTPQHGHRGALLPDVPNPILECRDVNVYYGEFRAVTGVDLAFGQNEITAMIGPSGCGKSTLLRSLNRMNDLIVGARVEGAVTFQGEDIYDKEVDAI